VSRLVGNGCPVVEGFHDDAFGIWGTLKDIATETEQTAEKFRRDKAYSDNSSRYFRFNVSRGLEDIGLEESTKIKEIASATRELRAIAQADGDFSGRCDLEDQDICRRLHIPQCVTWGDSLSDWEDSRERELPSRSQHQGCLW